MKTAARATQRGGIALIMVLMVIIVLAALAGGFAYSMRIETKLARNVSWDTDFEWMARSGIEVAKYALSQRSGISGGYDSLGQAWAGGRAETNDTVARLLGNWIQLGNGEFRVTLEDMDRKFNINNADEQVLRKAAEVVNIDASLTPTIISSILDWIDVDDDPRPNGAEKQHYLSLTPPYLAKNGRIDDITELLLVEGIRESPGVFWGSGAPPSHRRDRSQRANPGEEPIYPVGLRDLFCALSGGRLNINTASVTALQVLPFVNEVAAQAIQARRAGPDGQDGTEDDTPFRSAAEISMVPGLPPQVGASAQLFLSVQSVVFEVKVDVRAGQHRRSYVALLRRGAPNFLVLNLIWEDR
ncbi:MAG: general secretion pathway protein GspK [Verrucomicrobia bacterium]|nr:general secretion pathway protein GspK [Verrucomicrobiota bacterium]MBI3871040.1 general secretion pathway protein GspK [Verrucomicrobiota bacterium]